MSTPLWNGLQRTKDAALFVGFAPNTRSLAPWDDPQYDLWLLNEEYRFDWVKRAPDIHFQIHPRWDWSRTTNPNHYNHPRFLMNQSGVCLRCGGKGEWTNRDGKVLPCDECQDGRYTPPLWRDALPILMQEQWEDVPGSVAYPLQAAQAAFPSVNLNKPYFMSSIALMAGAAYLMGYEKMAFYGFEMGTQTEYHYQRANFEWLIGVLQAKGIEIVIPDQSPLLKGPLYAFESMRTGFRQNLEMRKISLEGQEKEQAAIVQREQGKIEVLTEIIGLHPDLQPALDKHSQDYMQAISTQNIVRGAMAEVNNLMSLYDTYFIGGTEHAPSLEEVQEFTNAQLVAGKFQKKETDASQK